MAWNLQQGIDSYASDAQITAMLAEYASAQLALWNAASAGDQAAYLKQACQAMDGFRWQGTRTLATQPLQWPRVGVVYINGLLIEGNVFPDFLARAQLMEAIARVTTLNSTDALRRLALQRQGVRSITFNQAASESYDTGANAGAPGGQVLSGGRLHSPDAYRVLTPYLLHTFRKITYM